MGSKFIWAACAVCAALVGQGCGPTASDCLLNRACDLCTMGGECAWCFETGTCQATETFCQGEIAYRPEQCEEGHVDEDAGSIQASSAR